MGNENAMRGNRATSCEYKKKTRVVKTNKHAQDKSASKETKKKATGGFIAPRRPHSSLDRWRESRGVGCRGWCGELRGQKRVGSRLSEKTTMMMV